MGEYDKCWDIMNSYDAEKMSKYIETNCKACIRTMGCPFFGEIAKEIPIRKSTKMFHGNVTSIRGKSPLMKVTGIKYDQDKLRLAEMIIDFAPELQELCKVWTFGANKYEKSNWKLVVNGKDRYSNALIRHLIAEEDNLYDDESKLLHAAHIAFNALARIHFILEEKKERTMGDGTADNKGS